jgi:nucleoside-diphosphate-sugar epimerase
LGSSLVAALIQQQQSVRILARNAQHARQLFGDAVTVVPGDITDVEPVQQVVDGVSVIYHLAGRLYHPATPAELYMQTHVEGTRTLLSACQGQKQLRRLVYVSTTGVFGVTGEKPVAEDAPFAPTNAYEATKLKGELLTLKAYQENHLPITIVRPGLVYGPGDLHLLGLYASIQKGLFRVLAGGKASLHPVYIDDLTAALLLCAERPHALGRSYNIAGEHPVTVRALATAIAHALDRTLPAGNIPLWVANFASDIFALLPGSQGERAPLTRSRVAFLTHSRIYDISRAKAELNYKPLVGLEEGIKRTVEWYCIHGYLADTTKKGKTVR